MNDHTATISDGVAVLRRQSLLHNWELKERQCAMRPTAQLREGPRSTGAERRAQQAVASGLKTDRFSILRCSQKHTNSLPVTNSACLKHSNFLNTKKRTETNGCSHEAPSPLRSSMLSQEHMRGTSLSCRIDKLMSNNSDLMSYSRMPFRPFESRQTASQHQIRNSWQFLDIEVSCAHCPCPRPSVLRLFHTFSRPNTFRRLRVSLVILDLLHSLFRWLQTYDRAQVSTSVHIQHLGSELSRIFCPRNFAQRELLTLQEIFHKQEKKLNVFHATQTHLRTLRNCGVEPTSAQCPLFCHSTGKESFACTASEGVSLSFCRRRCLRSLCSAVSDDCAAPDLRDTSRRGPSIHLVSCPITVDHHLQRVDIPPGFQLQCPFARAHEISADALCPRHVSSGRISHSSGALTQNWMSGR